MQSSYQTRVPTTKSLSIILSLLVALTVSSCIFDDADDNSPQYRTAMMSPNPDTTGFTDARNGTFYPTVTIGLQTWMARSLNYSTPENAYCAEVDLQGHCDFYGAQYHWTTAMNITEDYVTTHWPAQVKLHQGICPDGWRMPTLLDWEQLLAHGRRQLPTTAHDSTLARSFMAPYEWHSQGIVDTTRNALGFWAFPGGQRSNSGSYANYNVSYWWTATDSATAPDNENKAYIVSLTYTSIDTVGIKKEQYASVRCIQQDSDPFFPKYNNSVLTIIDTLSVGAVVDSFQVIDSDSEAFQFRILAGDTKTYFAINNQGLLTLVKPLLFDETPHQFELTIETTDGVHTAEHTIDITIQWTVTDTRDNQTYLVQVFGDQVWMTEDLVFALDSSKVCTDNCETETHQYLWHEAMNLPNFYTNNTWAKPNTIHQGICPDHWHVPTQDEWQKLSDYFGNAEIPYVSDTIRIVKGKTYAQFSRDNGAAETVWITRSEIGGPATHQFRYNDYNEGFALTNRFKNKQNRFSLRCVGNPPGLYFTQEPYITIITDTTPALTALDTLRTIGTGPVTYSIDGAQPLSITIDPTTGILSLLNPIDPLVDSLIQFTVSITDGTYSSSTLVSVITRKTFIDTRTNHRYTETVVGDQTWMGENLNYDGVPYSWCPESSPELCERYGRLYERWSALDIDTAMSDTIVTKTTVRVPTGGVSTTYERIRGACPINWHLPSAKETQKLIDQLNDSIVITAPYQLLMQQDIYERYTHQFDSFHNITAQMMYYGFTPSMAGHLTHDGTFEAIGQNNTWWSTGGNHLFALGSMQASISDKTGIYAASIRCVKNTEE
ncbi:MAG: hypothetical protein OCD76_10490 [Reichenbachiella sp.]